MEYNIVKIMTDSRGKQIHVLLTDGLSQIWTISGESKAKEMIIIMEGNSDSGWKYELRLSPDNKR
tara:strand:+ start:836 stop:1030 length:195 start_codon:yes stop_codon:yes gene_type:complete